MEVIEGLDKMRMHGECHEIQPSRPSEASDHRSAGELKLKPAPEHNSWRGPQEVDVSSQAGYWPLWTCLQYLGQLTSPCFKFSFCCRRNNTVPIHVASWTQHEVWKMRAMCVTCIQKKAKHRASCVSIFYMRTKYLINIFIWVLAS